MDPHQVVPDGFIWYIVSNVEKILKNDSQDFIGTLFECNVQRDSDLRLIPVFIFSCVKK